VKTLTEAQQAKLKEGIFDLIWKKSMQGKTKGLMNMFDHDPQVAKALGNLEKATDDLKKSIDSSKTIRDKIAQIKAKYKNS
jgi:hypothetical protein